MSTTHQSFMAGHDSGSPPDFASDNGLRFTAIQILGENETVSVPTVISEAEGGSSAAISDARAYFEGKGRKNRKKIETVTSDNILRTGANPESTPEWANLRKRLFSVIDKPNATKTDLYIESLEERGTAAWVIDVIQKDLDVETNEARLKAYAEGLDDSDRDQVLKALEVARAAHASQTQKREKDPEGLDNIPYINHPVQVANFGAEIGLSPEGIQASLLHDVLEDAPVTEDELQKNGFSEKIIGMVKTLSRDKEMETREQFLARIATLKGEEKLAKCMDRYHNLVRAFSINDPVYIERCLKESREIYLPAFMDMPELRDFGARFSWLLDELEKHRDSLN